VSLSQYLDSPSEDIAFVHAEAESRRFGFSIGRLEIGVNADASPVKVAFEAACSKFDVVIVRYPAIHADWFAQFGLYRHLPIHADTLVYFEKRIEAAHKARQTISVHRVTKAEDQELLIQLAEDSFDSYRSHYFANPLFDRGVIAAGYAEWASSFCNNGDEGRDGWLGCLSGTVQAVGFAGVTYEPIPDLALVGVPKVHSGKGLYGSIVDGMEAVFSDRGYSKCSISTQVHNLAVIRSVTKRGYQAVLALQTVHLVDRDLLRSACGV
jgi:hypothetical protein